MLATREDLAKQYSFATASDRATMARMYFEADIASIGFAKFMHIMSSKLNIQECAYTIADLNSITNYYKCSYFMLNSNALKRSLTSFQENKCDSVGYLTDYGFSYSVNTDINKTATAIDMYCNKLFRTAILANRIVQSEPNPYNIHKNWAAYGYKLEAHGELLFEAIKAIDLYAYLEFFCGIHMLCAPDGDARIVDKRPENLFDSFYAPAHQNSYLKMINKIPAAEWIVG